MCRHRNALTSVKCRTMQCIFSSTVFLYILLSNVENFPTYTFLSHINVHFPPKFPFWPSKCTTSIKMNNVHQNVWFVRSVWNVFNMISMAVCTHHCSVFLCNPKNNNKAVFVNFSIVDTDQVCNMNNLKPITIQYFLAFEGRYVRCIRPRGGKCQKKLWHPPPSPPTALTKPPGILQLSRYSWVRFICVEQIKEVQRCNAK